MELDPIGRPLSRPFMFAPCSVPDNAPPARPQVGGHARRNRGGKIVRVEVVPNTLPRVEQERRMVLEGGGTKVRAVWPPRPHHRCQR
eukprot:435748-Alexandrium_andersonii.AAC.1